MIKISELFFNYPGTPDLFHDFCWEISNGESWSIVGPSGSGKTTLLYLIAGLRNHRSGKIEIYRKEINSPRPETGLVLQDHGLLPWASIRKNILLGFTIRRFYGDDKKHTPEDFNLDKEYAGKQTDFWMKRLNIENLKSRYPSSVSGGQKQRTALARTLALNPDLLLMDEPFASLDEHTRRNLQNIMLELERETGHTRITVTHNIKEAVYLGRKILVLNNDSKSCTILDNPGYMQTNSLDSKISESLCSEISTYLMGMDL